VITIDQIYAVALHQIFGLQFNKHFLPLYEYYGSWQEMWERGHQAPPPGNMPLHMWEKFLERRKTLNPLALVQELERKKIKVVTRLEETFPATLLQIANTPCMLYYRGDINILQKKALAVVGARKASPYGLTQTRTIVQELAQHDLVIVSGLARGIDGAAHEAALTAGGKTVAVLGSGVDIPYPRENKDLYHKIGEAGLLLSEFPPGTQPLDINFPVRNRIISGLSSGVFIVEGQAKSGSLITCDYALEQGKEVFALPGPVTSPLSLGPLRLIQQGAKLVIYAQDILEELGYEYTYNLFNRHQEKLINITREEKELLNIIAWEPLHIDSILARWDIQRGDVYEILLKLELQGLIKQLPGKYYVKI
jgi:DNA processing protein